MDSTLLGKDTLVVTEDGPIPISETYAGLKIKTPDGFKHIYNVFSSNLPYFNRFTLVLQNDFTVNFTSTQFFYLEKKVVCVGYHLKEGMRMFDGSIVKKVTPWFKYEECYGLNMDAKKRYFFLANGLLTSYK